MDFGSTGPCMPQLTEKPHLVLQSHSNFSSATPAQAEAGALAAASFSPHTLCMEGRDEAAASARTKNACPEAAPED